MATGGRQPPAQTTATVLVRGHGGAGGGAVNLQSGAPDPAAALPAAGPPATHRLGDAAIALSLANLCFIRAWFGVLFDEDFGYFNRVPVDAATLVGLALNMIGLGTLFFLTARGLRRMSGEWVPRLAALAALALLLIPANFTRLMLLNIPGGTVIQWLRNPLFAAGALGLALAVWHWPRPAARLVRLVLGVLFPLTLVSLGKLVLVWAHLVPLRQHAGPPPLAPLLAPARTSPRVIWLVFDELDYRVVFAERPAGVRLPELDRLRAEALFATNAYPPANGTLLTMPALTTGRRVLGAAPCSPSDLRLTLELPAGQASWHELPSVFSRARALGFNSAIVAWHHPYRRVFSNVVSFVEWRPSPHSEMARGTNVGAAMLNQLWSIATPLQQRRLYIRAHHELLAAARLVATNRQYGLCFFHLPPPHNPPVYLAAENRFTLWNFNPAAGYFNNLALADRVLGQLRQDLEAAGLWEETWLIVSADHCWREAYRHDGRTDLRVPFLVKAPGRGPPAEHAARFNTLATHDLVMAILEEQVRTLPEVRKWLTENGSNLPPVQGDAADY